MTIQNSVSKRRGRTHGWNLKIHLNSQLSFLWATKQKSSSFTFYLSQLESNWTSKIRNRIISTHKNYILRSSSSQATGTWKTNRWCRSYNHNTQHAVWLEPKLAGLSLRGSMLRKIWATTRRVWNGTQIWDHSASINGSTSPRSAIMGFRSASSSSSAAKYVGNGSRETLGFL